MHATGRYLRNSLTEILENDFGFKKVYSEYELSLGPGFISATSKAVVPSGKSTRSAHFWADDHRTLVEQGESPLQGVFGRER